MHPIGERCWRPPQAHQAVFGEATDQVHRALLLSYGEDM
jgi:hypothetical protein